MADPTIKDSLMRHKDADGNEEIILPITRYHTLLNAPKVVTSTDDVNGAPFALLVDGDITIGS